MLAAQAQGAAARIDALVSATRGDVARAVEIVSDGARTSQSGAEVLDGSVTAFARIREVVAEVSLQVGQLERFSDQVAMVADTAVEATAGASESAGSATRSSAEIELAVDDLGRQATRLADSLGKFRLGG